MQRKEDGFTLIELVISMAVFSLVAIAIALFLQTGTNSYSHARNELNLQMESQMLINQIRDIAYSSNYAEYEETCADPSASPHSSQHILRLYYIKEDYNSSPLPSGSSAPASTTTPPVSSPSAGPGATTAPLPVTGSKQIVSCEVVVWDSDHKKLYYDKSTAPDPTKHASEPAVDLSSETWRKNHLFCSYMENFSVTTDGTGKIADNTISLNIKMKSHKRKYEIKEGITIRNKWVERP